VGDQPEPTLTPESTGGASRVGAVGDVPQAVATREASERTTRVSWRRDMSGSSSGDLVRGNLYAERRVAVHRVNRHFETKFPVFATIFPHFDCTSPLSFRATSCLISVSCLGSNTL
jgi:hypothetical protein